MRTATSCQRLLPEKKRRLEAGRALLPHELHAKLRELAGLPAQGLLLAHHRGAVAEARREKEENARPAMEISLQDIEPYDVIFLGYPNWCGTMPMVLWTFLESHDFTGKIIKPFCTHEGSGWGRSLEDLHRLCPAVRIEEGLTLFGTTVADAGDDVRRWLER